MRNTIIGSIPLLIAFLISIVRYKKLELLKLRLFPSFLMLTFLFQVAGAWYSATFKHWEKVRDKGSVKLELVPDSNHFIFNSYILIETLFYFYIFYQVLTRTALKKAVSIMAVFFVVFYIIEVFILTSFFVYNIPALTTSLFLTLMCCFLYFSELLMADKIINFFATPMFWIATGVMIVNVGPFLYMCFFNYIIKNELDDHGRVYSFIAVSTSITEYIFFIIGFLCHDIWKKPS